MSRNILETVMGAVVLAIAAIFLTFAYSAAEIRTTDGYSLYAKFNRIEGVRTGGEVRVSGIKVGTIVSTSLDPKTYQAVVSMNIDTAVKLPNDSVAQISSAGLLGDKFLELIPGASDTMLGPGGTIQFTQSPASLESLLGQAIYSISHPAATGQGGGAAGGAPAPNGSPAAAKP